ncbi:hypothetical protein OLX02_06660 [Novosphingobium sp. KCTC 2891]|nr:hypothetical protein [Novosphingobium sp. KCTC 2891]
MTLTMLGSASASTVLAPALSDRGNARNGPQIAAETDRPSYSLYAPGEPVAVNFDVTGLAPGQATSLALVVRDDADRQIASASLPLRADAAGEAHATYAAPHPRLGYYAVSARLPDGSTIMGEGTRPDGIVTYGVLPDPALRRDFGAARSRFGLQGGFNRKVSVLPWLGVRYVLGAGSWTRRTPLSPGLPMAEQPGPANGRRSVLAASAGAPSYDGKPWNVYPIAIVGSNNLPEWAVRPGSEGTVCKQAGALGPEGQKAFPAYAEQLARIFVADYPDQSPRIYQITWEPEQKWCFGGSAEDLVTFYRLVHDVIHRVDPNALVAGPTLFPQPESTRQLGQLWDAGLRRYIDAFALHPYPGGVPAERFGMPRELERQLAAIPDGQGIPFLGTEHGADSDRDGLIGKATEDLHKTLMMLGHGALLDVGFYVADYWVAANGPHGKGRDTQGFFFNLNGAMPYGTDRLGPKPLVPAYAAMTQLLDGSDGRGRLAGLTGTQNGYRFVRGGMTVDAVWDYGTPANSQPAAGQAGSRWPVRAGARLCDWMGNCRPASTSFVTLGQRPVYIVTGTP